MQTKHIARVITLSLALFLGAGGARAGIGIIILVSTSSPTDGPGTTWDNAYHQIQSAIDAATSPVDLILVTNGIYATGGRVVFGAMTNRVAITNGVTVLSVNGPKVTTIRGVSPLGNNAVRCAYVGSNAVLSGFTLENGSTRNTGAGDLFAERCGGGAWCEASGLVTNCIIAGNTAVNFGGGGVGGTFNNCSFFGNNATSGGGSYTSVLNNCVLVTNICTADGGGAYFGILNRCTLLSNTAFRGGGTFDARVYNSLFWKNAAFQGGGSYLGALTSCTLSSNSASSAQGGGAFAGGLTNCIVYFNTGTNHSFATLAYCCTVPAAAGTGNITNDPHFLSVVVTNLRLHAASTCINAGTNALAPGTLDLDGRARIFNGVMDMGAFEYDPNFIDSDGDGLIDAWELLYGGDATNLAAGADLDGDLYSNLEEFLAGTNPTNFASRMAIFTGPVVSGTNIVVRWQSATGKFYRLDRSTNLASDAFSFAVRTNVPAVPPENTVTDQAATGFGPWFYRVRLEP